MSLPGGIRTRIVLVLVGIVAGALGTAYMIVVPSLERRLVEARLEQLRQLGAPLARTLPEDTLLWQDRVESFGVETNARVVAFSVLSKARSSLVVVADSRTKSSRDVQRDPIANEAMLSGEIEDGRVGGPKGGYGEVAFPAGPEAVLLFQVALADSVATVEIVRERLLVATAFALVLALILGLTAAGMLAHRLLRLETAAERIAGGDFGAPIVDHGHDEIGELARAFDRMRVQLAQLDNARKEFVANASHELRTPLFSIGGFLELLADEELDEETRRGFIDTMQGQVQRLAKLSTDLLDLSRVDAGQLTVVREAADLGAVVQMLAGELGHLATSTGHELRTAIDDDVWCLGDDARILQIGRALATNALTHTPRGTHVTLRAGRRGDRAELTIEDDGPGIPASQREAVFARFYRAEGGMASGSGLGLAIAREIARLMGGDVRLDSESRPTVFTLDLPGEPVPHDARRTPVAFSRENDASTPEGVTQGS
jgi:two-component system, OmpR family, sensor kinase